ncbi:hypothetical protein ACEWPL_018040 [Roseovarius sp. S1116L3]|uniref:hypothetical protein n=1 Tax=Roseovarius roseus TaxID=3342636 RepID=UPI00372AF535
MGTLVKYSSVVGHSLAQVLKVSVLSGFLYLPTSSCGFTPVYGSNSTAQEVLASVELEDPTNRVEQVFLKAVEQRFPRPGNPQYRVNYSIGLDYQGLDVIGATRVQIIGKVVADLVDTSTSTKKFSFVVDGLAGYSATADFGETQRRDAEERLMQILADRFITDLMIRSSMLDSPNN